MIVLARMTVGWPVCPRRGLVRGVDLAVVVAAALELPPDVVVGPVRDHLAGAGVAVEEVLAHVLAVVGAEGLVVAVGRRVHEVHERAVAVGGEQRVPAAAPDDLDDVPAGAAEERLELLDDLAVAAHRAVEALQVAVDDEGEVVELLAGRELEQAARLGLVHLAVAEEGPHVLLAGVLDAAVVQVLVELRLVDGVHRADAHRHRRELPEVRHQPRVRVGRQRQRRRRRRRATSPGGTRRGGPRTAGPRGRRGRTCRGRRGPGRRPGRRRRGGPCRGRSG